MTAAELYKQYQLLEGKLIPGKAMECRKAQLTLAELEPLPTETPIYRCIGKYAFLQASKGEMVGRLGRLMEEAKGLGTVMAERRDDLETQLKAAEAKHISLQQQLDVLNNK